MAAGSDSPEPGITQTKHKNPSGKTSKRKKRSRQRAATSHKPNQGTPSMASILVTAFEPYDDWEENSSWLALVELTKNLPDEPVVTTRRYPVDFDGMRRQLSKDLGDGYDYAIHLGQSPRDAQVTLEAIGINVRGDREQSPERYGPLVIDAPPAYQTDLPLAQITERLRSENIPTRVSYHAGEYLCNATLYLSQHLAIQKGMKTKSLFVHLPLSVLQVTPRMPQQATLPIETSAQAIRLILDELDQL